MEIEFIAGFGPIGNDDGSSLPFWSGALGIGFHEPAPGYFHSEDVRGAKAFAIWPLTQAAEATFDMTSWPADLPVPQAWIEFDVSAPERVGPALDELAAAGYAILREAHDEPWGQTTGRVQSPEGILVGISYTSWMHPGSGASGQSTGDPVQG